MIVLLVLFKNYRFEKERIKALTLVTSTVHEKPAPFMARDSRSVSSSSNKVRRTSGAKNLNNPLGKLALWMGFNIFGQIIDLIESGLLMNADPLN